MKKKYRIGEMAKIKNIDAQTLRYYDKMGVLSPKLVDNQNRYRYYSEEQFIEVDRIKFYKLLGLSLEEVKKFKEINNVDEALKTLELQKEQFENKITKMQAVAKNLGSIIKTIEETRKKYEKSESLIEIKNCGSIYGVVGECKTVNDWYEFEGKLLELTERYPNYSEVGHNHGISFVYNKKCLYCTKNEYMEKIVMPIDKQFINDLNVQEYSLGKCIVAYHKGEHYNIKNTFSRIKEYINKKQLNIRGDIIKTSIISSFIVNNENEYLMEIKVPII
ncbi:MerR family transcriptional regulator [Tepidibacter hydrothermalis]|uniref:MerR family transcriptional regulator n=1 Tax=Tepidibacter hydrothermalis TaxID=3036126 RepID=A0ABY8EG14_9FIRM|nr:MerR family transcriptional regulator [Tepidibacter hydrothermalis]WFD11868.1 MerR family transcriptional regulator [Tepidibacter hydrothermalis]